MLHKLFKLLARPQALSPRPPARPVLFETMEGRALMSAAQGLETTLLRPIGPAFPGVPVITVPIDLGWIRLLTASDTRTGHRAHIAHDLHLAHEHHLGHRSVLHANRPNHGAVPPHAADAVGRPGGFPTHAPSDR